MNRIDSAVSRIIEHAEGQARDMARDLIAQGASAAVVESAMLWYWRLVYDAARDGRARALRIVAASYAATDERRLVQ